MEIFLCFEETEKSLNITPRLGSFFIIHFLQFWKSEKLYSTPFYWIFNEHVKSVNDAQYFFRFSLRSKKTKIAWNVTMTLHLPEKNSKNAIKSHFLKTTESKNNNPLLTKWFGFQNKINYNITLKIPKHSINRRVGNSIFTCCVTIG